MFDYATMRLIWWLFIGVVLIAFAITEGFDFGIGALLPFLGRSDTERRVLINSIGPTWEGNQVWLILLGGAIFAVWPPVYATLFSGLYAAMLLVLFALFFRPAGFDYRSKLQHPRWRNAWDWGLFLGGALPALLLGVLAGNLLLGLPFHLDADLRPHYDGTFFDLLHPFALLCGLLSLSLCLFHGAIFLHWRTDHVLQQRAQASAQVFGWICLGLLALVMVWGLFGTSKPEIVAHAGPSAPSNPLGKTLGPALSGWAHFLRHPWMWLAPAVGFAGLGIALERNKHQSPAWAFVASSLAIAGILATLGLALFPFLLLSSIDPRSSLTLWDASASHGNLLWSFWITVVFLPIVLGYTRWVYRVIWGKITENQIIRDTHTLY